MTVPLSSGALWVTGRNRELPGIPAADGDLNEHGFIGQRHVVSEYDVGVARRPTENCLRASLSGLLHRYASRGWQCVRRCRREIIEADAELEIEAQWHV